MQPVDPAAAARLDLYWIPLGAGARVVRCSGWVYERLVALRRRTEPSDLYHAALIARRGAEQTIVEMAPIPDAHGRQRRGVVAEGPVGLGLLRPLRVFRYEIRRWPGGVVPDLHFAVDSPVRLTDDPSDVERCLSLVAQVPTPVWGRDELGVGDMWNSNSVVAWVLSRSGLLEVAGSPPVGGRAPGWHAGVVAAETAEDAVVLRRCPSRRRGGGRSARVAVPSARWRTRRREWQEPDRSVQPRERSASTRRSSSASVL